MTDHRLGLRPAAKRDLAEIALYYQHQGGDALAIRWTEAAQMALQYVAVHPDAGSPRYMGSEGLSDIRFWRVRHFPYLVFYVAHPARVDVVRVLHAERDIPHWLLAGE